MITQFNFYQTGNDYPQMRVKSSSPAPVPPPAPQSALPPRWIRVKMLDAIEADYFDKATDFKVVDEENFFYDLEFDFEEWIRLLCSTLLLEVIDANCEGVTTLLQCCDECSNLIKATFYNTHDVTSLISLCGTCSRLQELYIYDLTNVTDISDLFYHANTLQSIILPWDTAKNISSAVNAFDGCKHVSSGITEAYQALLNLNVTEHENTFSNCGINTVAGAAALAEIPTSWGGLKEDSE